MKLYTEEQVKEVWKAGQKYWETSGASITLEELLEQLIPIELPSDEEIMQIALENTSDINTQIAFNNGAVYICKLIEEQFNTKEK